MKKDDSGVIMTRMIKLCGVDEKAVRRTAEDLLTEKANLSVILREDDGELIFEVTARGEDEKECKRIGKPVVKELKSRFGVNIYTTEPDVTLEEVVVGLLKENELTLTTAESCTGGLFASRIISVPGASDMYGEGFITYSNKAKRKYLGVKKGTLLKFGAVSEQTAREMAKGVTDNTRSEVGVAITGVAGPDGGSEEKPVGLVYIGVCVCGVVYVREFRFSGDRNHIREMAAKSALIMLRQCLLEYFSQKTFGKEKKKRK